MIVIGDHNLNNEEVEEIVFKKSKVKLHESAERRVYESYYFLKEFLKDKLIYGINTGFGPMAQYRIQNDDQIQLQYNLIRSHCSGSGKPIKEENIRATVLARLNTLIQGYSGVHPDAINLLVDLLNHEIYPVIYEHGGLGASGDLVQLAHLALTLIGEGEVIYQNRLQPTKEVFESLKIEPLKVYIREGLGLMNGTSAMSGIGMINLHYAEKLIHWSVAASAIIVELQEAYDDPFSVELNSVKHHKGQHYIALKIFNFLKKSKLIKRREEHLYDKNVEETILQEKVQEYYSIRCVPQILGPVYDTFLGVREVLYNEVNSVNDNPIIDYRNRNVFHGGNFHGDYVALEMDKLKLAMVKLSMLSERQLNYLLNDKLNKRLPPFVNLGVLGLNLGSQGMQFTATSTVAENQSLASSVYIHSIPSNNDNQDIVSMGANAALMAQKVILNSFEVLAIQFITIAQAVDALDFYEKLSPQSKSIYDLIRKLSPKFTDDSVRYGEIREVTEMLTDKKFELE
ncbi:MAG: aromatic amino acid lyase [Flavobacteriales bacterium]|nr:aromatic amino acid lyase [Flavobacteriales bacterium]